MDALRLVGEAIGSFDVETFTRSLYTQNDQEKTVVGYFTATSKSYKSLKAAIIAKFGTAAFAAAGPSPVFDTPNPFTDELLRTAKVEFQNDKAIIHLQTRQQPHDILAVKDQGIWKISLASLYGLDQMPADRLAKFYANAKLVTDSKIECVDSVHQDMDAGKFQTLDEVLFTLDDRMKQPIRTASPANRP